MKIDHEYRSWKKKNGVPAFHHRTPLTRTKEDLENALFVFVGIVLATAIIFFCVSVERAWGADDCQDPDKLSPELRAAYYQLKEAEKEIPGMKVSIRCDLPRKEKSNVDD